MTFRKAPATRRGIKERNALVVENLGLVGDVSRKIDRQGWARAVGDVDDLFQEGAIGLIKAAERFDERKGFQFSTYAYRYIWCYIENANRSANLIRLPAHIRKRVMEDAEWGERVSYAKRALNISSLSTPVDSVDGNGTLADFLLSSLPDESLYAVDEVEAVADIVETKLSAKARNVITKRFGLDDSPPMTLAEVGRAEGVSRERIRQIESAAMTIIKQQAARLFRPDFGDSRLRGGLGSAC